MTSADAGWVPTIGTFGERIAAVRVHLNWNMKKAADQTGIPFESWRRWENRESTPRDLEETCRKIALGTGCDYAWLVGGRPAAGARRV
ncbi:helix-turn-helix domain-containing protein [Crossiella sp. CA198]|uniref:helix-turn-helix domain-containing protein n=1 Tax=Crossiella sp. CA198 TaxID=3455607 RepID=UPI003F8D6700